MAVWRPMLSGDLASVERIAEIVHPDYPEAPETFADRLAVFPAGCRIAEGEDGAVGYALMHPGRLGRPPALDSLLGALPEGADCLYLHDVALLPAARGKGLGEAVLAYARGLAAAHGFARLALTSTPPARGYWTRLGFGPYGGADAALAAKLASYGEGMAYMVAEIRP